MRYIPRLLILIILSYFAYLTYFAYLGYQNFFPVEVPLGPKVSYDMKNRLKFNLPDGFNATQTENFDQEELKMKVFNDDSQIEIELVDSKPTTEISQNFYYTEYDNKYLTITSSTTSNSPEKIQELEKVRNGIIKSLVLIYPTPLKNYDCSPENLCVYFENYKSPAENKHQIEFLHAGNRLVTYSLSPDKSLFYERLSVLDNKLVILKREKTKFTNKISILDMNSVIEEDIDLKLPRDFKIMDFFISNKLFWILGSRNCQDLTCKDLPKELYVYDYDKKEIKLVAKDLFKGISPLILMNISNGQANLLVNGLSTETALVYQLDIQSKKLSLLFDGSKDEDNFMNYSKIISNLNLKIYQYLYFSKERGVYFEREIEPDYLNTFRPYELFKANYY